MTALADMVKVQDIHVSEAICKCECGVSIVSPSVSFSWNHQLRNYNVLIDIYAVNFIRDTFIRDSDEILQRLNRVFSISPSILDGL